LYLNKLQILGFKSFADKVHVDFETGITAIVGPNGCGKTNIVDAVRWVIGEQKASVLRSTTMENVIFNGTKNRKALGFAEVSLSIENTKGILPSEYSEITITRRCYRDGQSNYLINGTVCRLKDITALFMDTGMGSDAYSVIELKMVNDILSHRTQDRRKLFEEAAGITKYKERRREAIYKLEIAKENLTEVNIDIRNRQRQVKSFENIVQKQQEAREISERLKEIEIDYHQRFMSKLTEDTKQLENENDLKDSQRENIQRQLIENERQIDKLKIDVNNSESKVSKSRDRLDDVNSRVTKIQTNISMSEQRISHLKENIERFSREKLELENQIIKLTNSNAELDEKINVLTRTISLMEESQGNKRKGLDVIEEKVKNSKDELKELTSKHSEINKKLVDKNSEYEIIKNNLENQIARCTRLTEENINNINKISVLDDEIEKLENELGIRKNAVIDNQLRYENLRKDKDNLFIEKNSLEKELIYKKYETDKLKEKIQFQTNLLENFEDYSEGIKYLIKAKEESNIKTVLDKLEVNDKFKIAIETALGEISNYLIVDNIKSANNYVELLDANQKGKVTFIIKDNLYKLTMNIFQDEFPEIMKQEGVYGWADKFIKCPDDYILLYKYLLDEYIIVENLDTAKRLSSGNYIKFITLDGDIVTDSFVRAGGRTNVETLKIGREKLIHEFENKIKVFEEEIIKQEKELKIINDKYNKIDIDTIFDKLQIDKSETSDIENKISQINYKRNQLNSFIDSNHSENNKLSASNKELTESMDSLIKDIDILSNDKYQKDKELENFASEFEALDKELTTRTNEYNNFTIELTKVKAELNNLNNEKLRNSDSLLTSKSTLDARTIEANNYSSEISELKDKIGYTGQDNEKTGMLLELDVLNKEKAIIMSDYNLIKDEYDKLKKELDELENTQRHIRKKSDDIIKGIHDIQLRLVSSRKEIAEHKEKVQEDYNVEIIYCDYKDKEFFDYSQTKYEIDKMKVRLKQLGGTGQMELNLFEQEKKELEKLVIERDDLVKAEEDLLHLIEQINLTAQEKFKETFELIRSNFQQIFRELFMEGDEADLKLVTDETDPDPLNAKIDIIAKPRGKRPQLIDLLSGGEKTLTAIALLFAIYQVKPSPFCILDEVDAPLDDANIDRFIKIIRKFSTETQFIIVTHNKRTMEAADSMYGITMAEEGISTIVNVKFNDQPINLN
jgi:chromosome segregation protein